MMNCLTSKHESKMHLNQSRANSSVALFLIALSAHLTIKTISRCGLFMYTSPTELHVCVWLECDACMHWIEVVDYWDSVAFRKWKCSQSSVHTIWCSAVTLKQGTLYFHIMINYSSHSVEFVQERPHCPSGFSEGQTGEMNSYPLTKLGNIYVV